MKRLSLLLVVGLMILTSCADENKKPIITFDDSIKGAYVRLLSETARDINLFDIAGSVYTYSVEFVDLDQGNLISEYNLDVTFRDNNPSNGLSGAGPTRFRSYASSEFGTTDRGFKGIDNISISATELLSFFNLTTDDLLPGDQFVFNGTVVTTDGAVYGFSNSTAAVNGSAFQGHFDFTMSASCPTNLAGTYDATTIDTWCGDTNPYTVPVTFTLTSSGYNIDDFSFGAYEVCYGGRSPYDPGSLPLGNLRMVDVCNMITITGASQWGEIYTWHSLVADGTSLTVEWSNDYGEAGTSVITNPNGWPALRLQ